MSTNPARILKIENGIKVGHPADITIIDPERSYQVDAGRFQSLSRNTPFDGRQMQGKAILTLVAGKIVFQDEHFQTS
jgi:dihydroorotase